MQSYEDLVNSDNLYSPQQQKVLFFLPMISGSLSIVGSSAVIYILLRDWRRKLKHVYHRLLLAFSCIDVVHSLQYALSSLVVPVGTPNTYGARGTVKTCQASGFFLQFGQTLGLYAAFMCVYYLMIVRYKVKEEFIAKRIEPFVHGFGLLVPLFFGIFLLTQHAYNPGNIHTGHCFINVYPANCLRVEGVPCQRGENYKIYGLITTLPFFLEFAVVVFCSCATYATVRQIHSRQDRWAFRSSEDLAIGGMSGSSSVFSLRARRRRPSRIHNDNVRESLIQALLYVAAFFIAYIAFGITIFVGMKYEAVEKNRNIYFPLVVLTKLCVPSVGVWNFFIYIRPRYHQLNRRFPDRDFTSLLQKIFFNVELTAVDTQRGVVEANTGTNLNDQPSRTRPNSDPKSDSSDEDSCGETDFTPELHLSSRRVLPRVRQILERERRRKAGEAGQRGDDDDDEGEDSGVTTSTTR